MTIGKREVELNVRYNQQQPTTASFMKMFLIHCRPLLKMITNFGGLALPETGNYPLKLKWIESHFSSFNPPKVWTTRNHPPLSGNQPLKLVSMRYACGMHVISDIFYPTAGLLTILWNNTGDIDTATRDIFYRRYRYWYWFSEVSRYRYRYRYRYF